MVSRERKRERETEGGVRGSRAGGRALTRPDMICRARGLCCFRVVQLRKNHKAPGPRKGKGLFLLPEK
jgi:hypothetical protein